MTAARRRQLGLTLVELMVTLAVSLVVALAALAALVVSKRGFSTVDAASELRDNARFGAGMLQRITGQAGFLDWRFAMVNRIAGQDLADPPPAIQGFDNAALAIAGPFPVTTDVLAGLAHDNRTADCNTAQGQGCSDVLVVRYQSQFRPTGAASAASDQTMIDCSGRPLTEPPTTRDDQGISVFYVATHRGEPTLMCLPGRQTAAAGALAYQWREPVPVVTGVENFQVLYGADGASPGAAPAASATSLPGRYLRASQMAGNNATATNQNWRRVRSVRIGLVLRGAPASTQVSDSDQTLYPFGQARESGSGAPGSALSSTADKGTRYTPPADSRLRQTSTFTVYLHNDQGLCIGRSCAVQ